jgi:nucleoid-associated protein YgaU
MVDCPCGFGKNLAKDQKNCPMCGRDLTLLHRLDALPAAYCKQGLKLAEKGHLDSAVEKLMTAVTLDPGSTAAYEALANLYLQKGQYNEAIIKYEIALERDPENEDIKKAKTEAEIAKKASERSPSRLKRLLVVVPVASFLFGLVVIPLVRYIGGKKEPLPDYVALANNIKFSISNEPALSDLDLNVIPTDTGIAISGKVPSDIHRKLISEIARNTAASGSVDTRNLLVAAPPVETEEKQVYLLYTVKPGEGLIPIALKFFGDRTKWKSIYEANKDTMPVPHKIRAGQVILIPLMDKELLIRKGKEID